jgi:predicted dehydrogenase
VSIEDRRPLRVGIVGCGLIGGKRAASLGADRLVATFDVRPEAAEELATRYDALACTSVHDLLGQEPGVVIVATIHRDLADLACVALEAGAHVLVEKPAGVGVADIDRIVSAARRAGRLVKVGFNHRFHPGIARAIAEARSGVHGDVLFMRARYGHGGRAGYEREWRADPALSGGGELVDQGMHLIDLSHWLLGELPLEHALLRTQFWDAPVEDNAVIVLGVDAGASGSDPFALLHASWTEWKNLFSLEIACRSAKFAVDGLAGSYGTQTLRIYRMRPEMGPPDLEEICYSEDDASWEAEWDHFAGAIVADGGRPLLGDLDSARYAWSIIEQIRAGGDRARSPR